MLSVKMRLNEKAVYEQNGVFISCVSVRSLHSHAISYCNVKVKAKLSLCLTKHYIVKTYWRSGDIVPCTRRR